jgi:hypothetical protein
VHGSNYPFGDKVLTSVLACIFKARRKQGQILFALSSEKVEEYAEKIPIGPASSAGLNVTPGQVLPWEFVDHFVPRLSDLQTSQDLTSPWTAHSLHIDRVVTTPLGPETQEGMQLPTPGWTPSVAPPVYSPSDFGHYEFADAASEAKAKTYGLEYPSLVIWAAQQGMPVLTHIHLKWVPGQIEGTQGSGFGAMGPYQHLYDIDFQR